MKRDDDVSTSPSEGLSQNPEARENYWNSFYATPDAAPSEVPSQFAAFVAADLDGRHHVVEFGSGSGRDALFFAQLGHQVIGVDASDEAVARSQARADERGLPAHFVASLIDSPELPERIGDAGTLPSLVYARFFLHAITDEEQESFLQVAAKTLQAGDRLAVEYRTVRDLRGTKVTGAHYRRYLRPAQFQASAMSHGFEVEYAVEGFGFAKYKADDAYVARDDLVRV